MQIIKAESIIKSTWDQFFGHNGLIPWEDRAGLALMFTVEISIANHGYERDGNTYHEDWERQFYAELDYVITGRHQVFVKIHKEKDPSPAVWVNTSNHNSCWRSDGLRDIWETLSFGWQECYGHVPREHQRSMAEMNQYCNINDGLVSRGLTRFARVKVEPDPQDNYRRILEEVRPVSFTIQVSD